jgi:hypothetical protein
MPKPKRKKAERKVVIVSLVFPATEDRACRPAPVTVHSDARCVMPGSNRYSKCRSDKRIEWLRDLVRDTVDETSGRYEQVLAIAKVLEERAGELVEARCSLR